MLRPECGETDLIGSRKDKSSGRTLDDALRREYEREKRGRRRRERIGRAVCEHQLDRLVPN